MAGAGVGEGGAGAPGQADACLHLVLSPFSYRSQSFLWQKNIHAEAVSRSKGPVRGHWGHVGPRGQRLPACRSRASPSKVPRARKQDAL